MRGSSKVSREKHSKFRPSVFKVSDSILEPSPKRYRALLVRLCAIFTELRKVQHLLQLMRELPKLEAINRRAGCTCQILTSYVDLEGLQFELSRTCPVHPEFREMGYIYRAKPCVIERDSTQGLQLGNLAPISRKLDDRVECACLARQYEDRRRKFEIKLLAIIHSNLFEVPLETSRAEVEKLRRESLLRTVKTLLSRRVRKQRPA